MKTLKQLTGMGLVCLTFLMLFITACKKNESDTTDPVIDTPAAAKITTTLSGRIIDASGQPVSGALVECSGSTTTTDIMGLFLFKDVQVNKKRCSLKFTKSGFLTQYYSCIPSAGTVTYIKGMMITKDGSYTVSATAGGTVTLTSGASVAFPANAFSKADGSAYSGTVTVNVTYLDPDDSLFRAKTPGRDLYALDAQGTEKVLVSFGMMNVELFTASNEKLQLTTGKSATLTMPVATSQQATAPASMPLWYFDETAGLWREQGTATKTGSQYVGTVSHFSWWNCDQSSGIAFINGVVGSCDSTPFANVNVGAAVTDGLGNFNGLWAASSPISYVNATYYDGVNYYSTQFETVPTLNVGQVFTVPALVFGGSSNMNNVTGQLVDCNNTLTSGIIIVTCAQTGYWDYQWSNGSFSFALASNYTYKLSAAYNNQYGQMTISGLSPIGCAALDVGNLPLCNTIGSGPSNLTMTLTSALLGTQSLSYFVDHCTQGTNSLNGSSQISLSATDTVNNAFAVMLMQVSSYTPGNYLWNGGTNNIYFSGNLNGIPVTVNANLSAAGQNVITTAAPVGSNMVASFSGPVTITSPSYPGITIPGTLTGSFDVYRNQ
jgi:hypothetical protein